METQRLKLRQWIASDRKPFSKLNADPQVMEYFPDVLSETESNAMVDRIEALIKKNGWGFWAVELKASGAFIGFVGLHSPRVKLPFNPCIEIGWRLSKEHWGNGYATEAAQAALNYGFEHLKLDEIVSFTSIVNRPSQAVMRKINMSNTNENFMHPSIPDGNALEEHVLFKITKADWRRTHY
ncbi:GNAT family N-acetyltransferase [Porticoccaceae bacterium]|nr:GNAT family N-acetyltransferase [Porticoccaceae bacterium]